MAVRKHGTLVAATPATATLAGNAKFIEVVARGTGDIFFTIDGTTPTVAGDDMFVCPQGGSVRVRLNDRDGSVDVKLISSGTPGYSVGFNDENTQRR